MSKPDTSTPEDEALKTQVARELDQAKELARSLDFSEVKSGEWFIYLLRKVIQAYDRNARATYFQQKYPGLSPDEIATRLSEAASIKDLLMSLRLDDERFLDIITQDEQVLDFQAKVATLITPKAVIRSDIIMNEKLRMIICPDSLI